jgi:hypothetical protein
MERKREGKVIEIRNIITKGRKRTSRRIREREKTRGQSGEERGRANCSELTLLRLLEH